MPDELREQMPVIKEILHPMKIPTMELPGYEADDLIGTMSRRGGGRDGGDDPVRRPGSASAGNGTRS